jgi:hypothetical protein
MDLRNWQMLMVWPPPAKSVYSAYARMIRVLSLERGEFELSTLGLVTMDTPLKSSNDFLIRS